MGFPRDGYLIPLAAVIGACAGFAAQGYGQMVRLSEEVFFGRIADRNLSGVHLWLILALPMFGGLLVGLVKLAFHLPMIRLTDPPQRLIDLANEHTATDFVVCDAGGRYLGMVAGNDLQTALPQREALPLMIVSEIMRVDLPTVDQDETLDLALGKFSTHEVSSLAAIDDQARVLGVISRAALMRAYQESLDQEP